MLEDHSASTLTFSEPSLSNSSAFSEIGTNAATQSDIKDDRASAVSASDLLSAPRDLEKGSFLKPIYFVLDNGLVFTDKLLPDPMSPLLSDTQLFSKDYYINLHSEVSSFNTYNHLGARIPLKHSNIKVNRFRELLPDDYDDKVILQYIEYGFPLGLQADFILQPVLKNHSSAYDYFSHVDKFVKNELEKGGMTGPFITSPFKNIMISPLMTSPKKPNSRRTVFDASFSDFSLNVNTPDKLYLEEEYLFTFPKLDDFSQLILKYGSGCFLWKRDLSRFFLQLPLDPSDYDKTGCIWRGQLLFFTSYVWGTRHAGMNGQRVTNAVSTIHRSLGLSDYCNHKSKGCDPNCTHLTDSTLTDSSNCDPFNTLNYSDDFAGVQGSLERATLSFNTMGTLLSELGLTEAIDKAVSPCQVLTYLGIEFDTIALEMRINDDKCQELRFELEKWSKKTVATKSDLQSILGKLLWVSRAIKFSRCFVLRIIAELKKLKFQTQKITLSPEIRKDFLWWEKFMMVFNGVHLLVPNIPSVQISGDACPMGYGVWNPDTREYFSSKFPLFLQDPKIPIHIKEFICVIMAVKQWGPQWAGKQVVIFSDNDSVCDVISYSKPKDPGMQMYLREFLFWVCRYNFHPIVSKISTKDNDIADFLSRNYFESDANSFFARENFPTQTKLFLTDSDFTLQADW